MLEILTRELLSRRAVVRLLLRLNDRTCPSLVRTATSFSDRAETVQRRRSCVITATTYIHKGKRRLQGLWTCGSVSGEIIKVGTLSQASENGGLLPFNQATQGSWTLNSSLSRSSMVRWERSSKWDSSSEATRRELISSSSCLKKSTSLEYISAPASDSLFAFLKCHGWHPSDKLSL